MQKLETLQKMIIDTIKKDLSRNPYYTLDDAEQYIVFTFTTCNTKESELKTDYFADTLTKVRALFQ